MRVGVCIQPSACMLFSVLCSKYLHRTASEDCVSHDAVDNIRGMMQWMFSIHYYPSTSVAAPPNSLSPVCAHLYISCFFLPPFFHSPLTLSEARRHLQNYFAPVITFLWTLGREGRGRWTDYYSRTFDILWRGRHQGVDMRFPSRRGGDGRTWTTFCRARAVATGASKQCICASRWVCIREAFIFPPSITIPMKEAFGSVTWATLTFLTNRNFTFNHSLDKQNYESPVCRCTEQQVRCREKCIHLTV